MEVDQIMAIHRSHAIRVACAGPLLLRHPAQQLPTARWAISFRRLTRRTCFPASGFLRGKRKCADP